ncbi:piggyBac transposable element-derived protein 4-like [Penaeus japonicus]|uniref:piggyBac transposable element-derived protein 4-like n=1 Tax=Penaeus japonicus TaxID=27405 RepID=UPI001C715200|nr:piggyBac transposable element-derived protein 4-like [Penaeus japonicus]
MSRPLRINRSRSSRYFLSQRKSLRFDEDPDDPQPSTSGRPTMRSDPSPHHYLFETTPGRSEEVEMTEPDDGTVMSDYELEDDSDLDSDFNPEDLESDDDDDWDELEYVSALDSSVDSDQPLSVTLERLAKVNAPGTSRFEWKKKENVPRRFAFAGRPGVKLDYLSAESSAKDIFDSFFTEQLWEKMVEETNRYADQNPPVSSPHMKNWSATEVAELQKYPSFRDYWATNPLLRCSVFPEKMTRDRFDAITANLHFSDNEDPCAADDRLWKIRPVIDIFGQQFKTVFTPEQKITVDESLFAYRGRHGAVQFIASERARFGLKAYKLCASDGPAAGYTSAFKVYMGQDRGSLPASMKAVTDLMSAASLFDKGYELYTDNWYSSPTLFHHLQARKTNAVGTVRLNRKFMPKDLRVTKKGQIDSRSTATGMLALSWKDRKDVNMLSTIHRSESVDLPPNRRGEVRTKPKVVVDYNVGMKGVDLSDQMARSYEIPRKCHKWYQVLFYHLIDTALVNSYLVHRYLGGRLTHLEFRLQLIESLISAVARQPPPGRRPPIRREVHPRHDGHTLVAAPTYRRCKQCRIARSKRKEVKFMCSQCDVGLCPGDCFNQYHNM